MKSHLERLHNLECIVHKYILEIPQTTPTISHHLESIRDESSLYKCVPLCDECHRDLHGSSRHAFRNIYKLNDLDLLGLTVRALMEKKE